MKTAPARKTRRGIRHLLFALVLLLLAAGVILAIRAAVTGRRDRFLQASDYDFLKERVASADETYFYQIAAPFWEAALTPYESAEAVRASMRRLLAPENVTIARSDRYTEEEPVYTLYAGEKEVFTAVLSPGSSGWRLRSLTLSERCELGRRIVIEAPHGAAVTLNGVPLDPSDAEVVPYHALSPLEADLSGDYVSDRYEIGTLFFTPDPIVSYDGSLLCPDDFTNGCYRYRYPSSMLISRTITVPYGSAVRVNGIPLTSLYLLESGGTYPFLTRFETEKLTVMTSVYQISGLLRQPDIEVIWNDTELSAAGDTGVYALPDTLSRSVTVSAPSNVTVKINGVSLGQSEIIGTRTAPIFEDLTGYDDSVVTMNRYRVTGLLSDPILTAADPDGRPVSVNPYDSTADETVFGFAESAEEIPATELLTARTFAKLYILYVYSGSSGISAHFGNIAEMTPGSSPAFRSLKAAYRSVASSPVHTKISVKDPTVLSYTVHSETVYSVTLAVPFTANRGGEPVSQTMTIEILYTYSGRIRRILNYRVENVS